MISAICVSCRDEVAKAIRRALGDNGGVKFRHGTYNFRGGWSNAIDTVLKDNLLIEVYALRNANGNFSNARSVLTMESARRRNYCVKCAGSSPGAWWRARANDDSILHLRHARTRPRQPIVARTLHRKIRAADGTCRAWTDLHDNLGAEGQFGFGNLQIRQIKLEKRQMTNKERKA